MATATLLLPARSRLGAAALSEPVARALGRARFSVHAEGEHAQLQRHFQLAGDVWPVAALTRQMDVGDAGRDLWLRADPARVVPDMHGARLMGFGETLGLDETDAQALLPALQPVFAEHGLQFDAPTPTRWYLRVPEALTLPVFVAPEAVLGDDLFDHLPAGEPGRRWRALLSETQVVLHTHPWNAQRAAQGRTAINTLWFWGGGVLPDAVRTSHAQIRSRDALLRALALAAGVQVDGEQTVDALVDLRQLRSMQQLGDEAIAPLLQAVRRGELDQLVLDFEDGAHFVIAAAQRWQFWKKPRQLHDT